MENVTQCSRSFKYPFGRIWCEDLLKQGRSIKDFNGLSPAILRFSKDCNFTRALLRHCTIHTKRRRPVVYCGPAKAVMAMEAATGLFVPLEGVRIAAVCVTAVLRSGGAMSSNWHCFYLATALASTVLAICVSTP